MATAGGGGAAKQHQAFDCVPIQQWKDLPFQIEAIETYGERLLIGTSKGQLLVYDVPHARVGGGRFNVKLRHTKKDFLNRRAKQAPIQQLTVVEEFSLLLSLAEGYVHLHELTNYNFRERLEATKGASFYAVDVQVRSDPFADSHRSSAARKRPASELVLRLCAVVKRKLITFKWHDGTFVKVQELNVPDNPRTVLWAGQSLCVGFRKECVLYRARFRYHNRFRSVTSCIAVQPCLFPLFNRLCCMESRQQHEIVGSIIAGLPSSPGLCSRPTPQV